MKRFKKYLIWLIVLGVLGGGAYYFFKPKVVVPESEVVRKGTVSETISVTGDVVPKNYADLSFQQIGTLTEVLVADGEQVEKGQIVARVSSPTLNAQLRETQVALELAIENETLARRNWDVLKPEEKEARKLATEQARASQSTARAQMVNTVLRSPFSGKVTNLNARIGETANVNTKVMRVAMDDSLEIEARIPESDIADLKEGMKGIVTFDALRQDEEFEASIVAIDTGATIVDGVVSYKVTFALDGVDARLRDGMTANIDIESAKSENALIISYRALERDGDQYFVEVLKDDNSTERREVTIGLEGDGGEVEINTGLKEGEKVTIGAKQKP
jgi:RND family efflux transporter MFP subunit